MRFIPKQRPSVLSPQFTNPFAVLRVVPAGNLPVPGHLKLAGVGVELKADGCPFLPMAEG
jgi:hypothetical protein